MAKNKTFRIETEGIKETMKQLGITNKQLKILTDKSVMDAAILIQGEVKQSIAGRRAEPTSVDTSNFLQKIFIAKNKVGEAKVFSPVPYSIFLEYGTSNKGESKGEGKRGIAPRNHFRNSLNRNKLKIHKMFKDDLRKAKNVQ